MKKPIVPPYSSSIFMRLLLFVFLSTSLFLWGCDKAGEAIAPAGTQTLSIAQEQAAKSDSEQDDKYKTDKTDQYVSKDVQVTGYEDGSERPTRPKFDAAGAITGMSEPLDPPCDPNISNCSGTTTSYTKTPVSSVGIGSGAIYDLKIRKGSSSSINTSDLPGYTKIPVDLNRGAGGKYIYLCFTRDPAQVQGSSVFPYPWVNNSELGRNVPVRHIEVRAKSTAPVDLLYDFKYVTLEAKDDLGGFYTPDLNDGAGGKYIYAYQKKGLDDPRVVKEVGVIYGSSSSIVPPSPWVKIAGDLNEGAGGDYIYFVVKY